MIYGDGKKLRDYVVYIDDVVRANQAALERGTGFLVVLVTNPRGVAREKVRLEELQEIHQYVLERFARPGAGITAIYFCPHEGGCDCRKPAPGMLLRAAKDYGDDLCASWLVGDNWSDIEAGQRAGCRTAWITDHAPDLCGRNVAEVPGRILELEGCRAARQRVNGWSLSSLTSE